MCDLSFDKVRENVEYLRWFGFKDKHLVQVLRHAPWTLRSDHRRIQAFLVYFHQTLRLPKLGIANLCAKDPRVASLHLEKTIVPCAHYFIRELDMPLERFASMVEKYPRLLSLSIEERIRPIVSYFLDVLKTPRDAFLHHLRFFPGVLGTSLEKSIQFRVRWIQEVTHSDHRTVHYICLRGLVLFETKSDILFHSYEAMLELLEGDQHLAARILRRVPHVLSWPPSTLRHQLLFVRDRLKRKLTDLYHFPSLLGMSVKDHMIPRVELMERLGFDHERHSLFVLFHTTDWEFKQWLQNTHGRLEMSERERERIMIDEMTGFKEEPLDMRPLERLDTLSSYQDDAQT